VSNTGRYIKAYLVQDTQDIPYIENEYILMLRHFMQQIQATLKEEEDPWTVPTSCEQDKHSMEKMLAFPLIHAKDYNEINYCRLYLQVTTIVLTSPHLTGKESKARC
jgi:hypothetical protein